MMNKLLIATHNKAKVNELSSFLSDLPIEIISLLELQIKEDVEEDGSTYLENSQKKALFFAKLSGIPSLSDDGGIEIDALGGAPGIHSRRWLGYEATDEELIVHMQKVARELPDSNRKAIFRTVVSIALPDGRVESAEGSIKGIIAKKPNMKEVKGYPYRSFFYLPNLRKYYHESEIPRNLNHRFIAFNRLKPKLIKLLSR